MLEIDYTKMVGEVEQLERNRVWCTECGRTQKVNSSAALKNGWPKCCDYTMTIDSPAERAAFSD